MFASVNNSTDSSGQIIGYISNAGIPSIANQTVQELDVITPYSVFPLVLLDKAVGMAWWKNIVDGKRMQSTFTPILLWVLLTDKPDPYGSSESSRIDGTAMSSFVSWDSKITTVNAILGGVSDFVRQKMQNDGIYAEFIAVLQVSIAPLPDSELKILGCALADSKSPSASTEQSFQVSTERTSRFACPTSRFRTKGWKITQIVNENA